MPAPSAKVIDGYEAAAPDLIEAFDALSSEEIYTPLKAYLTPRPGQTLLDIGAATGRDAACFSLRGYQVTAVEPVPAFRAIGKRRYPDRNIRWVNDRLPALAELREMGNTFDVIVINAVWQHLLGMERMVAMRQLARICAPEGLVVLSLRHGPGVPDRPCYPVIVDETIEQARHNGFELCHREDRLSLQAANRDLGVNWTWLVLRRTG